MTHPGKLDWPMLIFWIVALAFSLAVWHVLFSWLAGRGFG